MSVSPAASAVTQLVRTRALGLGSEVSPLSGALAMVGGVATASAVEQDVPPGIVLVGVGASVGLGIAALGSHRGVGGVVAAASAGAGISMHLAGVRSWNDLPPR